MSRHGLSLLMLLAVWFLRAEDTDLGERVAENNSITRGPFRKVLVLNGSLISPTSEKFLVPRTNSWEAKLEWMVPEGSSVRAGDVVVRFDNSSLLDENLDKLDELLLKEEDLLLKKAEAEEALLSVRLQIREAEINLAKAVIDAGVPAELQEMRKHQEAQLTKTKAEEAVKKSRKELETLMANQKAQLAIAELEIEALRAVVARNERMIDRMALVANTSGIAVYEEHPWEGRTIQIGDSVQPGWSVMRIPDPENMQAEIWAGEIDLGLLQPEQTAAFFLDAYPDRKFTGKVTGASNRGMVRNDFGKAPWFKILMNLDSVDVQIMKPGMSVRAEILVHQLPDCLLVPIHLVHLQGEMFLLQPAGKEARTIDILGFNSFHVALAPHEGLAEGVVLEPVAVQQ